MGTTKSYAGSSNNIIQTEQVYCICRSSSFIGFMIMCDFCTEWFHGDCIGVTAEESKVIDAYCCTQCEKKYPMLKTTYKERVGKKYKAKKNRIGFANKFNMSSELINIQQVQENSKPKVSFYSLELNAKSTTSGLGFVDTTIRKAKTDAYEKFKCTSRVSSHKEKLKKKSELENVQLFQCYGPSCTKTSRKGSKYCSDNCGESLAKHRILEILPQRLKQWMSTPSVADELNRKKLNEIRAKLSEFEKQLEAVDIKIIELIDRIQQWKKLGNAFINEHCDDTTLIDCVLCGMEVQNKAIERHLEQCYKRSEVKIFITEYTDKPIDVRWNVFCNHKISKNLFCKKMKVLCPEHYKDFRKADEVCGYKLREIDGVSQHCGNIGKTCNHVNWEDRLRAELDLEKLKILLNFNELMKEKNKIRRQMSERCNLLGLMLHQTISH